VSEQELNSPPWSEHTERVVLGAMILESEAINVAIEKLVAEDFYLDSNQRIFRAMMEIVETGNPLDMTILLVELDNTRQLSTVGGHNYLMSLTEGIPRNFNIESYIRIVKDKSLLRQVMGICHDGATRASDQSEAAHDVVSDIEEQLLELVHEDTQRGFSRIIDEVQAAGGFDPYLTKMADPAEMNGLAIGFVDIDKMLGGLKKQELTIIGGRPSQGKSAMGLCAAANVVKADPAAVVAYFSLEMSKASLFRRLLASQAHVSWKRALEGWLGTEEKRRLASSLILFGDKNLLIDDTPAISLVKMRAKCRRLKQQHGRLDLIVVDYLQLLTAGKRYSNRQEEVGAVSRGLKAAAKELDVPVMALCQVGRGSEQRSGDKRPMLSDLRESGQIEADADVVAFIHRPEYYASPDDEDVKRGIAEILIAKNRDGATGSRDLAYLAEYTLFENLAEGVN
jgi:replicative DNA helicase